MKHKKSVFNLILALMVVALLASVHSPVVASTSKAAITGFGNLSSEPISGKIWADAAGNFHFRDLTFRGDIWLEGDEAIQGTQTLEITGCADPTQSGPFTGRYTIRALEGTVLWSGVIEGYSLNAISVARVVAQGRGPYAGTQLKLAIFEDAATEENPDPQTFQMQGQILVR